jgi:hypothetical protein
LLKKKRKKKKKGIFNGLLYGLLKFGGLPNFGGLKPLLKWLTYWAGPAFKYDKKYGFNCKVDIDY